MFDLFTVLEECAKTVTDFSVKANGSEVMSSQSFYDYCELNFWDRNVVSRTEILEDVVSNFKKKWSVYLAFNQENINRMFSAFNSDYKPLDNTERTETTTITSSGIDTTTNTVTYGKTTTNSGTDSNDTTMSASGYNNAGALTPTGKDANTSTYGKKITDGGVDSNTTGVTYGKKDITEFHTSGTIGVITNQDMIEKELKLRENVLQEKIVKGFIDTTTIYC